MRSVTCFCFIHDRTADVVKSRPTCAICIAWLLFRSHILAVLSQDAVKTLLPSWVSKIKKSQVFLRRQPVFFILYGNTYITPANVQYWTCVHLLGFGDSLSIVLHLPTSDLKPQDEVREYTKQPLSKKLHYVSKNKNGFIYVNKIMPAELCRSDNRVAL